MDEGVVVNVAESILEKLHSLRRWQDTKLLRCSRNDLENLRDRMQAVLADVGPRSVTNQEIRLQIQEVIYEIEDFLDDCYAQYLRQRLMPGNKVTKEVRIFFSSSNQLVYGLKVARGVRDLIARLDIASRIRFSFIQDPEEEEPAMPRRQEPDMPRRQVPVMPRGHSFTQLHQEHAPPMPRRQEPAMPRRQVPVRPRRQVPAMPRRQVPAMPRGHSFAQLHQEHAPPMPANLGRRFSFAPETETLVGRDADREAVVETLLFGKCDTVPIVGVGGVGKTWLARFVFNDERIKRAFDARWWVTVGETSSFRPILEKIVMEFSHNSLGDIGTTLLLELLFEKTKATKFLLVLDDVWYGVPDLVELISALNNIGYRGSMILLTTRDTRVAEATMPIRIHYLKGLSKDDSWLLFERWAFQIGQVPTDFQREIGLEIISKCGGNPMAIRAIGSLLYTRRTDSEWLSLKNELWKMDGGESGIFSFLWISYNNLPWRLKQCFACCSLFPKNHKIRVPKLINLWMAQGFVRQSASSPCLEAVGLSHFMELLRRSFFEEVEKDEFGNAFSCKMNNLMHDLATTVAGTEFVLSSEDGGLIKEKSRHAAFFVDPTTPLKFPAPLLEARKLRTLLLINETRSHLGALQPGCRLEEQQIDLIASNLGVLRVLDLHSSNISKVPSSICKLMLLTYLDLSENRLIKALPDSITRLLSLQILKLDNCHKLKKLPKDTKVLANLIHLGVESCSSLTHMPSGIGRLTCMSTLSRFVLPIDRSISKYSGLDELRNLNDLRGTLRIYNLPHAKGAVSEFQAANLHAKENLCLLRLEWSDGDEDHNDYDANEVDDDQMAMQALEPHLDLERLELRGYRGTEFASWLSSLTNLVGLALESCEKCQRLPPLHQLSHLKFLTIEGLTALKYVDDGEIKGGNSEEFFPSLEKLVLSDCPELQGWWKAAPATSPELELPCLSRLSHLSIMACPKLSSISMPAFPPLSSVKISDFPMAKLEQILVRRPEATSSGSSSSSSLYSSSSVLEKLETLDIEAINDLVSFPEDLFQNLKSLRTLRVSKCRRLKTLFQAIRHLASLTTLSIEACQELDLCDGYATHDVTQWKFLKSLKSLSIDRIPKLVSLPEWIRHLTFLQRLELSGCRKLLCLPNWMTELRALQILIITWCPQLTDRCQKDVGNDWRHISHIPNIIVARKTVKGSLIN